MIDFALDSEHQELQEMYRKFAEERVKPLAHEMDEAEKYDMGLLQEMKDCGFFGIPFSEVYGGAGGDVLSYVLCMEEMSKVDASTGITLSVHTSLCASTIEEFGTEEQKQKWLRPLADGSKIGCFGLTEPGAGSDVAGARTVAIKDGDEYVINGEKIFTTNSGFADTFLVFAITDKAVSAAKGMSAFIVKKGMPGLSVSANIPRMGIRAASNCEVVYDNVRVPAENRIGKEGEGFKIAMKALDGGRIGIAAQACGVAYGAIEEAVKYSGERVQFGKPINANQGLQWYLADMATRADAAWLLTLRAAALRQEGKPCTTEAAMAKWYAAEAACFCCDLALQIHGGYGYMKDYAIERMYRDARILRIYEGTSEVQKMVISRNLLK